jgi:hypothetical protein
LMEKFSKVTTFTRRTADSVIDNPKIPPQVRRLLKNPEVQTLQNDFDSARIYLARWAMGIAEQSERDRNQRIWTARDVLEMEETDVGEFELLDTEMGSLTLKEQRKTVTMKEWNSFFDQKTGRLQVMVDEVKERIFHGGLDPEDGVRKEAWLFLLGVYDWDSSYDERKGEIASLRDEYVKLKGAWWDRLVDLGGEGEEGDWWREQKGRIGTTPHYLLPRENRLTSPIPWGFWNRKRCSQNRSINSSLRWRRYPTSRPLLAICGCRHERTSRAAERYAAYIQRI